MQTKEKRGMKTSPAAALKEYWRDDHRFADLFNQAFGADDLVAPESLVEKDSDVSMAVYRIDGTVENVSRQRDVIKTYGGVVDLAICGIENQAEVHLAMPVRSMVYDGLTYARQCKELAAGHKAVGRADMEADEFLSGMRRDDRILPVINLVLYYGNERDWDGPTRLSDMMDIPEHMKPYFSDYRINVINVRSAAGLDFKHEDNRKFFAVARYIYEKGHNFSGEEFEEAFPGLQLNRDTASAIAAATRSMRLLEYLQERKEEEVNIMSGLNMVNGFNLNSGLDFYAYKKWKQGVEEGLEQGLEQGMKRVSGLYEYLLSHDMLDELKRSVSDYGYQQELLERYCIDNATVADEGPAYARGTIST